MPELSNLAIVTGASRGIGAAVARMFAELGVAVLLVSRTEKDLNGIADYLEAEGLKAYILAGDVTLAGDQDRVVDFVKRFNGGLRYLVHNAGTARLGSVAELNPADWRRMLEVNLTAPFMMTQKLLPHLNKGSQIFFINSVAGKNAFPGWSGYCASKAGLKALADTLRQEVRPKGIRVTTLYPGAVDTNLHDNLQTDWDREKMLKPSHIAGAIKHIITQPEFVAINDLDIENTAGQF